MSFYPINYPNKTFGKQNSLFFYPVRVSGEVMLRYDRIVKHFKKNDQRKTKLGYLDNFFSRAIVK